MVEKEIQAWFIGAGKKLAVAESCTGGRLAARLTRLPDASRYFLGSLVVYSNQLKSSLLGIPDQLLKEHGAVSRPVVESMALNVLKICKSDYGVAVSGIAGPGGATKEKPLGTVWACICNKDGLLHSWKFQLSLSREEVMDQSVEIILNQLFSLVKSIG